MTWWFVYAYHVYNHYIISFEDLLKKDNRFKIYNKSIQWLVIELFKAEKGIANPISCDIFPLRSTEYNIRCQIDFSVSSINITDFGLNSLRYFASKVWNMVLLQLKNLDDIEIFKSEMRK